MNSTLASEHDDHQNPEIDLKDIWELCIRRRGLEADWK